MDFEGLSFAVPTYIITVTIVDSSYLHMHSVSLSILTVVCTADVTSCWPCNIYSTYEGGILDLINFPVAAQKLCFIMVFPPCQIHVIRHRS